MTWRPPNLSTCCRGELTDRTLVNNESEGASMNIVTLLQKSERPLYPLPQPWHAPPSPYNPSPYSPSPYPTPSPAYLPSILTVMARRNFDPKTGGYKGSKLPRRRGNFEAAHQQQHEERWKLDGHEPMEDVVHGEARATRRGDRSDKASHDTRDKTWQSDRSKPSSRNPRPIDPRQDAQTIKRPPPVRLIPSGVVTPSVPILSSSSPAKQSASPAAAGEVPPPESPAAWSPGRGWEDYSPTAAAAAADLNATSAPIAQKSAASPPPLQSITDSPPPAPPSPPPGFNVGQNGDTSAGGDSSRLARVATMEAAAAAVSGWTTSNALPEPEPFSMNIWPPLPEEDPPESPNESTHPPDMDPAQAPDILPELGSPKCEIVFCDDHEQPPSYSSAPVSAPYLPQPVRIQPYLSWDVRFPCCQDFLR